MNGARHLVGQVLHPKRRPIKVVGGVFWNEMPRNCPQMAWVDLDRTVLGRTQDAKNES